MNIEELKKVFEDCGAAEMPVSETCLIAQISEDEYEESPELKEAYRIGQLKTKLAVRQSVIKLAREGIPQMVKIYMEFANPVDNETPAGETADDLEGYL